MLEHPDQIGEKPLAKDDRDGGVRRLHIKHLPLYVSDKISKGIKPKFC